MALTYFNRDYFIYWFEPITKYTISCFSSNDASAEGTAEIAKGSIIAREKIEEIRNALVNQHPRLENPFDKRLPLRQEQRGAEHN